MPIKAPKNSILIPVDFSKYSDEAMMVGSDFAKRMNLPVTILHVIHDPNFAPGFYSNYGKKRMKKMEDIAQEMMDQYEKKFSDKLKKLKVNVILVAGIPVTRILQVAEKIDPFLIVMGSQGRTQLAEILLGSKASHVLRLAKCPVTIVKVQPRRRGKKND